MIFVTVGTYSFDRLIMHIDKLIENGFFSGDNVLCQIGSGEFEPKNCQFFRYDKDLSRYYDDAEFIICHGGTGSTTDCIRKNKKFISVANVELADNHQVEFLNALSKEVGFCWVDDPNNIQLIYDKAKYQKVENNINVIFDDLNCFINGSK
ncbi:hypothetical protein MHO82_00505 [Vibrio sp. Of7-15]|uniref:PssE/Cps14G family polysaccharide biosynthesis glycosyltransferase n=1 Tax=Vibrio sp. Of7-15 TaxID=2724879 RepID=UPI001EF178F3|nr:PssE/Cps14G family polysaccharide biosynthesis glycosyltransferase [Vibrio sp. Of7-15]MCG7495338.1 hypothetical protein [Vibrio sp. Of7-15]